MAFELESFRVHVSVLQVLSFLLFVSLAEGQTVKLVERPGTIYSIEGEAASVTCSAEGPVGKIEFWRRSTDGLTFIKINNTNRVYATSKTEGNRTTAVLHIKKVEQSDDSNIETRRRYSCRVFNQDNAEVQAHDFHVNVIKFSDLPTAVPNSTVILDKNIGEQQQLKCNITYQTSASVKKVAMYWFKDGVVIDQVDAGKDGKFKKALDILKFDTLAVSNAGTYECMLQTKLKNVRDYNVTGGPFILNIIPKINEDKRKGNTIETTKGKTVTIECGAIGAPLVLEWKVRPKYEKHWKTITDAVGNISVVEPKAEEKLCNETRYCIKEKKLEIKDVQYSDRGFYNCCVVSQNIKEKNYCQEFVLRVRDPLGPLWPVIGIIVEVLVLFLIIYFTEKRKRSKAGVEKVDARAEFSYSSTDDGDKGHVRLRSNAEKSDTQKDAET